MRLYVHKAKIKDIPSLIDLTAETATTVILPISTNDLAVTSVQRPSRPMRIYWAPSDETIPT